MYEAFYGLQEKPFSIQPDPGFLFMGRRHSMAYAMLEYGVANRAGFTVISGEIGCGKTTLIRNLLSNLDAQMLVGLVSNTHQDITDLLEWVMLAFGLPYEGLSKVALYDTFQQFLVRQYAAGKRVQLIVDEAQNLSPGALESLRVLSNINADKDQLLQVILVGQPQLKELIRRPELRQLRQRVSSHFFIPPLETAEVASYITHRLAIAGRVEPLFTAEAFARIAQLAGGIPRSINILCDTALVYGFSEAFTLIDVGIIDEVLKDQAEFGVFSMF